MRFFGLKSCDTCKTALRALADREVEVIDVRADGVSAEDRIAMVDAFGDWVLNRRSTTWRNLSELERAKDPGTLIAEHPTLIKRPVIELNGVWYQGWTADTKAAVGVE